MKRLIRYLSVFILLLILTTGQFSDDAFAKSRRRSFSSRRRSSYGSKSGSSQTGYSSRSKTRQNKGSIFSSKAKKTSRGTSIAEASRRADSKSKFISATQNGRTNKSYKDVVKTDNTLRDSLTIQNSQSRNKRRSSFYNSSPTTNDRYYHYQANVGYRDPYDNFFFRYVTLTWLFHHWHNIDKNRFDEERLQDLEHKMEDMEAQGIERYPGYTMEGVDPDLQYSDEELLNLQEAREVLEFEGEAAKEATGFSWLTVFLIGLVLFGGFYFVAVRKY